MLNTSLPPWPCYSNEEAEIATKVLLSNKVNSWTGEETKQFELEFAAYLGTKYSIAVANGTLALELCLIANNVGSGDEVVCYSTDFFSVSIMYCSSRSHTSFCRC